MANQLLLRNWPRKLPTKFGEITQTTQPLYAAHGHLRSPILVPIESHIRLPISD